MSYHKAKGLTWLLVWVFVLSSCSLEKLLETGQYDLVIQKAIDKLERKPNDYKAMEVLRKAYFTSTNQALSKIDKFKEADSVNWYGVYQAYQSIERRQQLIHNLDNLNKFKGMQDYTEEKKEAQEKAALVYYEKGVKFTDNAYKKEHHQKAYHYFVKANEIYPSYRDVEDRIETAKKEGTYHILFKVENPYELKLPPSFLDEVQEAKVHKLNNEWMQFYSTYSPGFIYDFTARLELHKFEVSGNKLSKDSFTEKEEIIDKYVKVKDANGKVVLDEKGKPKVKPVYKEVSATIKTITRSKSAEVKGELQLVDNFTMNTYDKYPIKADSYWDSETATYKGDKRALSKSTKRIIGSKLQAYPSNEEMLSYTASELSRRVVFYMRIFRNQFQE